jgi:hypothetical protein
LVNIQREREYVIERNVETDRERERMCQNERKRESLYKGTPASRLPRRHLKEFLRYKKGRKEEMKKETNERKKKLIRRAK